MNTVQVKDLRGETINVDVTFIYLSADPANVLEKGDQPLSEKQQKNLQQVVASWKLEHPQWVPNLRPLQISVAGDPWKEPEEEIRHTVVPGQGGQRVRSVVTQSPRGEACTLYVRLQPLTMSSHDWCRLDDAELSGIYQIQLKMTIDRWWAQHPDYVGDRELQVSVSGNPWNSRPDVMVLFFVEGEVKDKFDRYFERAQGPGLDLRQIDDVVDSLPWIMVDMTLGDEPKGKYYREMGPIFPQPSSIFGRLGEQGRSARSQRPSSKAIDRLAFDVTINALVDRGHQGCPYCNGTNYLCPVHHAVRAEVARRESSRRLTEILDLSRDVAEKAKRIAELERENARLQVAAANVVTPEMLQDELNAHDNWLVDKIEEKLKDFLHSVMSQFGRLLDRRSK